MGYPRTARDEILDAFASLGSRTARDTFSPQEIVDELARMGSKYPASTIRTHVVSRMCAEAPENHAVTYEDLERVDRGLYRLKRP